MTWAGLVLAGLVACLVAGVVASRAARPPR